LLFSSDLPGAQFKMLWFDVGVGPMMGVVVFNA
jgi:hypothetical protein